MSAVRLVVPQSPCEHSCEFQYHKCHSSRCNNVSSNVIPCLIFDWSLYTCIGSFDNLFYDVFPLKTTTRAQRKYKSLMEQFVPDQKKKGSICSCQYVGPKSYVGPALRPQLANAYVDEWPHLNTKIRLLLSPSPLSGGPNWSVISIKSATFTSGTLSIYQVDYLIGLKKMASKYVKLGSNNRPIRVSDPFILREYYSTLLWTYHLHHVQSKDANKSCKRHLYSTP